MRRVVSYLTVEFESLGYSESTFPGVVVADGDREDGPGRRGRRRCVPGWRSWPGSRLLAADGVSNTLIADKTGVSRPTVISWRNCYQDKGIDGLADQERPGRRRHIDHRGVVAATLAPPPEMYGVTHWSTRWLARYLRIGDATVARAWREYPVQP